MVSKLKTALICVLTCAVLVCGGVIVYQQRQNQKPEITDTLIAEKVEEAGELTTARLTYNGILHYEDGSIPFLTRKAFFMVYRAEVTAAVDLAGVKVAQNGQTVVLTFPEETLDIQIAPDSIEFYDEHAALFNWSGKDDAVDAIQAAKADVEEKANLELLRETARNQTEHLLTNLLQDFIGERTLQIQYR